MPQTAVEPKTSYLSQIGGDLAYKTCVGFDKTSHVPPKLDSKGFNIDPRSAKGMKTNTGFNVLSRQSDAAIKIPEWWKRGDKATGSFNKTQMLERRL